MATQHSAERPWSVDHVSCCETARDQQGTTSGEPCRKQQVKDDKAGKGTKLEG